jgi:hypothetical protein
MPDETDVLQGPRRSLLKELVARPPVAGVLEADDTACLAFGYLRGMHERALGLELRLRNGNREWLPYGLLASCRFDPSVGLLLKFTGDVVTLVLVRGSNLDLPVHEGAVDLIERGLGRHRVTFIREMGEDELRKTGEKEPTIDSIEVAEFETREEMQAWLARTAPEFVRPAGA